MGSYEGNKKKLGGDGALTELVGVYGAWWGLMGFGED